MKVHTQEVTKFIKDIFLIVNYCPTEVVRDALDIPFL